MPPRTLSTRIVYRNPWTTIREDTFERDDGSRGLYGVAEKANYVVVLPLEGASVHLVEQYRYPIQARRWELPQGAWEHAPTADPADVARGELREETGLTAGSLTRLGRIHPCYGFASHHAEVFLARDLVPGDPSRSIEEQDMVCQKVPLARFEAMIRDGEITDAATLAAYMLFRLTSGPGRD